MFDIEKFVLNRDVEGNLLIRTYLIALKYFGYILCDNQKYKQLHFLRGVIISFSFILFNITQVQEPLRFFFE